MSAAECRDVEVLKKAAIEQMAMEPLRL